ncbi:hypothetical protein ABW19_dt0203628 [Dactylella cylindrospora]|nr:hypothetical protein ABW19_dt0203628 [Dactylella cylindrospora]
MHTFCQNGSGVSDPTTIHFGRRVFDPLSFLKIFSWFMIFDAMRLISPTKATVLILNLILRRQIVDFLEGSANPSTAKPIRRHCAFRICHAETPNSPWGRKSGMNRYGVIAIVLIFPRLFFCPEKNAPFLRLTRPLEHQSGGFSQFLALPLY